MKNKSVTIKAAKITFWGVIIAAFIGVGGQIYASKMKHEESNTTNPKVTENSVERQKANAPSKEEKGTTNIGTQFNATHDGNGDINQSSDKIIVNK